MLACILKGRTSTRGDLAVEGSGSRRQGEGVSVRALLASGTPLDRGSAGGLEMVLGRRPGPHGCRALVDPRGSGPHAGSRERDRRAALRRDFRRGESGVRREAEGGGAVARALLR